MSVFVALDVQAPQFSSLWIWYQDFANALGAPLNRLTSEEVNWKGGDLPENALTAYNSLKQALTLAQIVNYPRKHRRYSVIVDTSTGTDEINGGVRAILHPRYVIY